MDMVATQIWWNEGQRFVFCFFQIVGPAGWSASHWWIQTYSNDVPRWSSRWCSGRFFFCFMKSIEIQNSGGFPLFPFSSWLIGLPHGRKDSIPDASAGHLVLAKRERAPQEALAFFGAGFKVLHWRVWEVRHVSSLFCGSNMWKCPSHMACPRGLATLNLRLVH